ncbi:MAG: hypothetical protein LBS84_09855 [Clostridiales bacterium]|nr:hypothetical protein [Clostridiales bacterium]
MDEKAKAEAEDYGNTTAKDWIGKLDELAKAAPISIPESAKTSVQSKIGYEQIKYSWDNGVYKYEIRWHTRTPGAPADQKNTWIVERTTHGNATGQIKTRHIYTQKKEWVKKYDWQEALRAYQKGVASDAQRLLLESGHWKAP